MRKLMIGILAGAAMTTPMAAMARPMDDDSTLERRAPEDRENVNRQDGSRSQRGPNQQGQRIGSAPQGQADFARNNQGRTARPDRREGHRNDYADRRDGRRDYRNGDRDYRDGNRDYRDDRRHDRRDWNRNWRNDHRYDWRGWRNSNRVLFSIGRYYAPYGGHRYSRFSIGFRLGPLFYSSRYWISDPWRYRLPPAYAGTRWIRYYDDALLVDMYSGEVIDVIYNFFW